MPLTEPCLVMTALPRPRHNIVISCPCFDIGREVVTLATAAAVASVAAPAAKISTAVRGSSPLESRYYDLYAGNKVYLIRQGSVFVV